MLRDGHLYLAPCTDCCSPFRSTRYALTTSSSSSNQTLTHSSAVNDGVALALLNFDYETNQFFRLLFTRTSHITLRRRPAPESTAPFCSKASPQAAGLAWSPPAFLLPPASLSSVNGERFIREVKLHDHAEPGREASSPRGGICSSAPYWESASCTLPYRAARSSTMDRISPSGARGGRPGL